MIVINDEPCNDENIPCINQNHPPGCFSDSYQQLCYRFLPRNGVD